jgi:hypothetical protein
MVTKISRLWMEMTTLSNPWAPARYVLSFIAMSVQSEVNASTVASGFFIICGLLHCCQSFFLLDFLKLLCVSVACNRGIQYPDFG